MTDLSLAALREYDGWSLPRVRYVSFVRELESPNLPRGSWDEIAAGLVVLRHADAFLAGGTALAIDQAERGPIDRLPHSCFTRPELESLLDVVGAAKSPADRSGVTRRKWKYARRLEFQCAWRRAIDVYESILSTLPRQAARRRITCLLRIGYCHKWDANFAMARASYRYALEDARSSSIRAGMLRSRFALADISMVSGDLDRAGLMLSAIQRDARRAGARGIYARSLHGKANLAYFSHRYEESLAYARRALRLTPVPEMRNRIWSDIANCLVSLGATNVAKAILIRLHRATQQHMLRWGVTFTLLEIAAAERDSLLVDTHAAWLLKTSMSSHQRAYLYSAIGEAYDAVGRAEQAQDYMRRAVALANEHGFGQLATETSSRLDGSQLHLPRLSEECLGSISRDLAVADTIRSE